MAAETLLKVLDADGLPHHGGHGEWPLPKNGRPGKWLKIDGDIEPCRNGLHLCRPQDLVHWLGPTIWLAEAGRERVAASDKIVVRRARLIAKVDAWDERLARLFAADCAEHILKAERKAGREPDKRCWDAVRVARDFARGKASDEERSAAESAAESAAWSAAESAAWSAAWSAAESAARSAAESAAWSAARSAAESAARSAAESESAERDWQTKRLMRLLKIEVV